MLVRKCFKNRLGFCYPNSKARKTHKKENHKPVPLTKTDTEFDKPNFNQILTKQI